MLDYNQFKHRGHHIMMTIHELHIVKNIQLILIFIDVDEVGLLGTDREGRMAFSPSYGDEWSSRIRRFV